MKKFISVILVVLMLFTITACGGSSGDAGEDGAGDTTLTVWYWGEQEIPGYSSYMEELVSRFEAANPGVKVDAVLQESDTLYSAFRTAESAGEGPDLQYLWGGAQALEDAWLGNLVPVSDYVTKEQMADINPNALAETFWDGKQWGLPAYQVAMSVAYNKEIMKDAGLDPEKPYTTWDEFIAACEAIKQAGYTPFGAGLKDGWFAGWWAFLQGAQNLDSMGDLINAVKGDADYADRKYSEWVYKFEEMIQKGYFNNDIQSLDFYQGQQSIESGTVGMTFHAHAYAGTLEDSMGSDVIGYAPMPVYGNGELKDSYTAQTQVYVMPKSGKNKELAAKFLLFIQEPDNLKLLYDKTNAFFPSKNFDSAWMNKEVDKTVAGWMNTVPSGNYQGFYPPMFESEGIVPVIQSMAAGSMTADEAVQQLDETLVKWREQNPDQLDAFKKWVIN
ncbi:MAG TPA: ABC transporter substrate-binding protein [Anaerovoracaceae bacterium]|nr:ABC transporter substrate-binding protein [Anaerovoracaceae bacterium]